MKYDYFVAYNAGRDTFHNDVVTLDHTIETKKDIKDLTDKIRYRETCVVLNFVLLKVHHD